MKILVLKQNLRLLSLYVENVAFLGNFSLFVGRPTPVLSIFTQIYVHTYNVTIKALWNRMPAFVST